MKLYPNKISKKNLVFGEGPKKPLICLIGEAPGKEEVFQNRPFVGRAGKILNSLLALASLARKDLYITNLIKRPLKQNHSPPAKELMHWKSSLLAEISPLKPKVLICLGRYSSKAIFSHFHLPFTTMKAFHGKIFKVPSSWGNLLLISLYHPSAAGRNKKLLSLLKKDFQKIKKCLQCFL